MKREIIFLLTILTAFIANAQVPTSKLIFYAPFDGNVNDKIGNVKGSNKGGTSTKDRFNNDSSAWYFDGVNDWINYDFDIKTKHQDSFSISLWVQPGQFDHEIPTSVPNGRFTILGNAGGKAGFRFFQKSTKFYIEVQDDQQLDTYFDQDERLKNSWTHLVAVSDNGIIRLYANGIKVDSVDLSSNTRALGKYNFEIGRETFGNKTYWEGKLDDLRIYNKALNPKEVSNLFSAELKGTGQYTETAYTYDTIKVYDTVEVKTTLNDTIRKFDTTIYYNYINDSITVYDTLFITKNTFDTILFFDTIQISKIDTINVIDTITFYKYQITNIYDTANIIVFDTLYVQDYDSITIIDSITILRFDTIAATVYDTLIFWNKSLSNDTLFIPIFTTTNFITKNSFQLYPNPAATNQTLFISYTNSERANQFSINIINVNGKTVWQSDFYSYEHKIPISEIGVPGIYNIQMIAKNGALLGTSVFIINNK